MGCVELCGGVHTAPRQTSIHIHIGFYVKFSVSMSVSGSDSVNTPKFIFTMIIPSQDGLLKKKTETHSDFVPYSLKLPITSEMNFNNQH